MLGRPLRAGARGGWRRSPVGAAATRTGREKAPPTRAGGAFAFREIACLLSESLLFSDQFLLPAQKQKLLILRNYLGQK